MSENKIKEYLEAIGSLFAEQGFDVTVEEKEDGPVLLMTGPSVLEENGEMAYSVSMESRENGFWLFHLMLIPVMEILPEQFSDMNDAIAVINPTLTMGSYRLLEQGKMILFSQGFLMDGDVALKAVSTYLLRNLYAMERTVGVTGQWLYQLCKGQCTLDEIKAVMTEE